MSDKPAELSTKQKVGIAYAGLGAVFGIAAGAITFIASWIYCVMTYGFVLGLGLGWLPAAICAGVIGWLVALFWGVAIVLLLLGAILAIAIAANSTVLAYAAFGAGIGWLIWRFSPSWLSGRQEAASLVRPR
jgi:hypothetical protein